MRFYGSIETNFKELKKEYGEDGYCSVDSIMLLIEGEYINIDFEEGDYRLEGGKLIFRLKSLGCSFVDEWKKIGVYEVLEIENNLEKFKGSELISVSIHIPENISNEMYNRLIFYGGEYELEIGDNSIEYTENIEVEY